MQTISGRPPPPGCPVSGLTPLGGLKLPGPGSPSAGAAARDAADAPPWAGAAAGATGVGGMAATGRSAQVGPSACDGVTNSALIQLSAPGPAGQQTRSQSPLS